MAEIRAFLNHINGENTAIALFFIGLYGLVARRNIIKSIMSIGILQMAIILYFVSINAGTNMPAPIGTRFSVLPSDPVPHALMITAVVIGISVTAVSLTMFITLYHSYGSTNWNKVRRKRGEMP